MWRKQVLWTEFHQAPIMNSTHIYVKKKEDNETSFAFSYFDEQSQ